jgi:hypothetical protein
MENSAEARLIDLPISRNSELLGNKSELPRSTALTKIVLVMLATSYEHIHLLTFCEKVKN